MPMTTLGKSATAWGLGAVLGAVIANNHRIAGGVIGALAVGSLYDAHLERKLLKK